MRRDGDIRRLDDVQSTGPGSGMHGCLVAAVLDQDAARLHIGARTAHPRCGAQQRLDPAKECRIATLRPDPQPQPTRNTMLDADARQRLRRRVGDAGHAQLSIAMSGMAGCEAPYAPLFVPMGRGVIGADLPALSASLAMYGSMPAAAVVTRSSSPSGATPNAARMPGTSSPSACNPADASSRPRSGRFGASAPGVPV